MKHVRNYLILLLALSMVGSQFVNFTPVLANDEVNVENEGKDAVITKQPVDYTGAIGDTATYTVAATDAKSYMWQYTEDGSTWYNYSNIAGYTNATFKVEIMTARAKRTMRCKITGTSGKVIYSNTVKMIVGGAAAITKQPVDYTGAIGDTATYTVAATNAKSYTWQYTENGSTWYNYSNIAGYTNATFKVEIMTARAKRTMRCKITGMDGKDIYSNTVKMIVGGAATITKQPVDYTGAIGDTATYTVAATNAKSYTWQYTEDGSTWYNYSNIASYTNATFKVEIMTARAKRTMRCKITGMDGKDIYSNTVKMIVGGAAAITKQPVDYTGAIGDTATYTVAATNAKSYTWQYTEDGSTWYNYSNIASYTNATFKVEIMTARAKRTMRCKITGMDGKDIYSNTVKMIVGGAATITKQPVDFSGLSGETATYTVAATNAKSYTWQYTEDGSTWYNYSNIASYTNATFTVEIMTARAKRTMRCKITGTDGKDIYSNTVKMIIIKPITITSQPVDQKAKVGSNATFSVTATGDNLKYKWEVSKDNGVTWTDAGSTTSTLSIVVTLDNAENLYRCVITDNNKQEVISNSAKLTAIIDKNPEEDETELLNEMAVPSVQEEKDLEVEKEAEEIAKEVTEEVAEETIEQE